MNMTFPRTVTVMSAALTSLAVIGLLAESASAMAIRGGFNDNTLARNDDGSTGRVGIGFDANFFGTTYDELFVNNNGNVTFDNPLSTFTPFGLLATNTPIIAPFFADVDTRDVGNPVTYGNGSVSGRTAFGVNWDDVGYFLRNTPLNSFQLVLIDRADTGVGNFDFEFNYNEINWETGDASDGVGGLGGSSARVGFSNGSSVAEELIGSAVNGALLDNGPNSLVNGSQGSNELGRYLFTVRNGSVVAPPDSTPVPTPALLPGLIGFGMSILRKKKGEAQAA